MRDLRKADKARIPAFAGTDFTPLERRKTRFSRGKQILFGHEKEQNAQKGQKTAKKVFFGHPEHPPRLFTPATYCDLLII